MVGKIIVVKRIFDFVCALICLFLLFPVLVVVCIAVYATLGRPIIFYQERPGLYGRVFRMYKFRTMREVYDLHGCPLPDKDRLTYFGSLVRSLSLDELPELWNVLKGEMSLVGPRPLLVEYLPLYTAQQARRHEVKPGITGWAQINGRNAITWEQKFSLDVWYVENRSFLLDLKILLITVIKIFRRENIAADGHVTVDKFVGKGS